MDQNALKRLTTQEIKVALELRNGCSNKEIAKRTHLADGTIKVYLSHIYQKLKCDRHELTVYVLQVEGHAILTSLWAAAMGQK